MLSKCIKSRKKQDALLHLMIVTNPHLKDQKALIKELQEEEESDPLNTTYDREGLQNLKSIMGQGRGFQVK